MASSTLTPPSGSSATDGAPQPTSPPQPPGAARAPREIWEEGLVEGERRLRRRVIGLVATGFAGGVDIVFSIVLVAVATGALVTTMPEPSAHLVASLSFGLGFAFLVVGRAELFTENFLIPVGTVLAGRARLRELLRMWLVTLVLNLAALALFAAVFATKGVLPGDALHAAGQLADTYGQRAPWPAFLSAIAAGTAMTLFTWMVNAAESSSARLVGALIIGFVLAAPSLNHAIVSFGEILLGLFAGTAKSGVGDLARNFGLAVAGNLVGGIGIVFVTRLAQVLGEPSNDE